MIHYSTTSVNRYVRTAVVASIVSLVSSSKAAATAPMHSASAPYNIRTVEYAEAVRVGKCLLPHADFNQSKGDNGRVAVIGGSSDYTGAPYFSAISSMQFGADLAFVFCASEASIPIKCYSPDLMVTPFYQQSDLDIMHQLQCSDQEYIDKVAQLASKVINSFHRFDSLVIGPGLGRDHVVLDVVADVITYAKNNEKLLIIDADGLYLLSKKLHLISGYHKCVLTPNNGEFNRLYEAAVSAGMIDHDMHPVSNDPTIANYEKVRLLSVALNGVTILRKGYQDVISNGNDVYVLDASQHINPKRCGGQGDILSGCLGTSCYWGVSKSKLFTDIDIHDNAVEEVHGPHVQVMHSTYNLCNDSNSDGSAGDGDNDMRKCLIISAMLASFVTKSASKDAFAIKDLGVTASDIIQHICKVIPQLR